MSGAPSAWHTTPHETTDDERTELSAPQGHTSVVQVWIITDAVDDEGVRYTTTLLRPEEY